MASLPVVSVTVHFDPNATPKISTVHDDPIPEGSSLIRWTLVTASGPAAQFRPPADGNGVILPSQGLLGIGTTTPGDTTWEIEVENENHTGVNQSAEYVIWAGVAPDFQHRDPSLVVVPDPTGPLGSRGGTEAGFQA